MAISLAYVHFCCRQKKCHVMCDIKFATIDWNFTGTIHVQCSMQYTNSLMIIYAPVCSQLTLAKCLFCLLMAIGYAVYYCYYCLSNKDDHVPRLIRRWLVTGPVLLQGNLGNPVLLQLFQIQYYI